MTSPGAAHTEYLRPHLDAVYERISGHTPADRLQALTVIRSVLDDVHRTALVAGMLAAQADGWGLRRIAEAAGCSHEQVRRVLGHLGRQPQPRTAGRVLPSQAGVEGSERHAE